MRLAPISLALCKQLTLAAAHKKVNLMCSCTTACVHGLRWDWHIDDCLESVAKLLESEVSEALEEQFARFPAAHAHFK